MIKVLRVDDRLLHGQVAVSWTKVLGIQTIVITNDSVVNDEFLKMTLGLAKPLDVELKIINVDEGIEFINENYDNKKSVMVIVNNLIDARRIIEATKINSLNIGNMRERKGSSRYSFSMALTSEDVDVCKDLLANGVEIEQRMLPSDSKVYIKDLLNKK